MTKMKAQTAMEYLMTYGWAILIVIIVGAALYALGIFNPATYTQSTATGFQGFQIPSGGWQFVGSSGQLTLQVKNMAGSNIDITNVTATYAGALRYTLAATGTFAPGTSKTITITDFPTASSGAAYSIPVKITYSNLDSGLSGFTSTGTMTGTVS
jgi:hypothetical protein